MILNIKNSDELKKQLNSRPLALYGMGTIGIQIAKWCDSQNIEYIIVDRAAKEKCQLIQKNIVMPQIFLEQYKDANVIISTNIYFDEIKDYLLKNGFCENRILSYLSFMQENTSWLDLEDIINWNLMRPSVELFSDWINEEIKSVADYGAGQMYLKKLLKPNVIYYPIDYMKRFEETIVCDLNLKIFPDLQTDAAILNGILEFLTTAEDLIKYICNKTNRMIILSYMTVDKFPNISARRASGYISDLSERKILDLLGQGGFQLIKKAFDPLDKTDSIYLFEK